MAKQGAIYDLRGNKTELELESLDYHRNGICGIGFHVVLFLDRKYGPMVATVFPEEGAVAVLQRAKLAEGNVRFFENSWRGDVYEPQLRQWIKEA